jgi:hypothetical protein
MSFVSRCSIASTELCYCSFGLSTHLRSQSLLPHTTKPLPRLIFRPVIPLYGQWHQILSNDINMREKRDRPTPFTPLSLSRLHLSNQWKGKGRSHLPMKLEYPILFCVAVTECETDCSCCTEAVVLSEVELSYHR